MIWRSRLFTRPKAECEDGAASGWGHSRACPEFVEGLPLKLSPYFFIKSPQKWIFRIVGDAARRARPRGERCKALFIYAKKPPQIKREKKNAKNLRRKTKI